MFLTVFTSMNLFIGILTPETSPEIKKTFDSEPVGTRTSNFPATYAGKGAGQLPGNKILGN